MGKVATISGSSVLRSLDFFYRALHMSFRALQRNILRSALTVLGILIGISAVIVVTALGSGARTSVQEQIESIGSNLIVVFPERKASSGASGGRGSGTRLTEEDGRAIAREVSGVAVVAPLLTSRAQAIVEDRNIATSINGTTTDYLTARSWDVELGLAWTRSEEQRHERVVLIGQDVRDELFPEKFGLSPVGQSIRIGRYTWRIAGVLKKKGGGSISVGSNTPDNVVLMPIGSMRGRLSQSTVGQVNTLMVSAKSPDVVDKTTHQIDRLMRQRHRILDDGIADFGIQTLKQIQETIGSIYTLLTLVLVAIAAISLAVGGIGVMNIMLVSVTERTREIGIRMAIGARARDIQLQFVIEAFVLSLIGGIFGVSSGMLITLVASVLLEWKMNISVVAISVSIFVSGMIGIGFGFFPARRAASLDPILALRHE